MNFFKLRISLLLLLGVILLYLILLFLKVSGYVSTPIFLIDLDERVMETMSLWRTSELIKIFMGATFLGAAKFVVALAAVLTVCLSLWKRSHFIVPFWIVLVGTEACVFLGKISLMRTRPDIAVYLETSASFPSGHAAISLALYGFLAYLLTLRFKKIVHKILLYSLAIILILAVGFSRLYLGVHYLSDVIAGYALGILWLIVGMIVVKFIMLQRKKIPPSSEKYLI
ncbi:MAG: hypothetical protein COU29_04330 [Candidatus Magasanikbacteria bacterium CG10_big_fil_rev_8_21_14_0_10_36_32]|uniref:Phosphatidic acid phosphatase type 2/haloperoxidase domain-containing protein n=1 Tax=Candidatus Magasanikbacteria bacterium CG10_big_fil_rev_8_21_14_0_10_36_32 TaxID=1974646 RepID=A0A2M6W5C2_9BACT|nr:MAG: hypothetical protein COU29_04330 [Candidatus Magasanikbacteria bacterium CG10_big_fil_rev_8_21_14_0_10_36_32]